MQRKQIDKRDHERQPHQLSKLVEEKEEDSEPVMFPNEEEIIGKLICSNSAEVVTEIEDKPCYVIILQRMIS